MRKATRPRARVETTVKKKISKKIDPKRQRKSSRNGGALKKSRKIDLNGAERFFIQNAIEKIKQTERTDLEKKLLKKVR